MKAILHTVRKLSEKIEMTRERLVRLRILRDAVSPELDGLPKNPSVQSRVEKLAVAMADCESELHELQAILISCRIELCEWLTDKISDGNICRVMIWRYGFLKKFSEIARELNFSESAVFRFHRLGLMQLNLRVSPADDYKIDSCVTVA